MFSEEEAVSGYRAGRYLLYFSLRRRGKIVFFLGSGQSLGLSLGLYCCGGLLMMKVPLRRLLAILISFFISDCLILTVTRSPVSGIKTMLEEVS